MFDLAPKIKSQVKRVGRGVLIFLGVCLVAWVAVINPYLKIQEKKRFETASAKLQELSEQIQDKIGRADSVTIEKSCGYSSAKFSKGYLSCSTELSLTYNKNDLASANNILSASSIIDEKLYPDSIRSSQTSFDDIADAEQRFSQEFMSNELLCHISYVLIDTSKFKLDRADKVNGTHVLLSCGGPARDEHYSITN